MRSACKAISPSSKFGTNSVPSLVACTPDKITRATAPVTTGQRCCMANSNAGVYTCFAQPISRFSFSLIGPRTNKAIAAGTKVSERIKAANKAMTTVKAMGWNIFPSTPLKAKIGTYTIKIIITPNTLGRITSMVDSLTIRNRSASAGTLPCIF